ncbi:MAG TPA: FliH/SctL family protein [Syntrophomonadaceae bacterium]|nr:FliH/SctL family protein [Syntrophomonadaceae bacterium]
MIKGFDMTICAPMIVNNLSDQESRSSLLSDQDHEEMTQFKGDVESVLAEAESMVRDILDQARLEARSILLNGQEEAEVLVLQARQEAETIREEARRSGYELGLRTAQEESEADRQMAMEQCQEMLQEARRSKIKIMESSTADIVRLAMAVAKKIVAAEIRSNPKIITNVIREAIGFLDQPGKIYVYVNPQEMEQVLSDISEDTLAQVGSREFSNELVADPRIEPGGCLIESDIGTVDARLETRVSKVENAIQEVIADESNWGP